NPAQAGPCHERHEMCAGSNPLTTRRSRTMFRHVFMLYVLGVSVFVVTVFAAGQSHVITQKDKAFSVAELTAKSGDTIVFKNDDDVAHNVFSQTPGFEFNAKTQ